MLKPLLAAVAGIAFGYLALKAAAPRPVPVVAVASAAPAPVVAGPLGLVEGTLLVDDDALYLLGWQPDEGTTPLAVVAIDRAALAVKWRSLPLRSVRRQEGPPRLVAFGSELVVVDGIGAATSVDTRTGALTPRPTAPPAPTGCARGETCADLAPMLKRLAIKKDDAARFAVASGRLLRLAPGPNGQLRLTGRDLATKATLFDDDVPGLGYGSTTRAFLADRDDVFLVANGALLALDARTGRLGRRFDTF